MTNATSEYYRDKIAVVTGGASGIGLALAETMLSYGAKQVVLADFNDENLKRETARLDMAYTGKVLGLHCDVTKEEDVRRMIHKASSLPGVSISCSTMRAPASAGILTSRRMRIGRRHLR
jgi:NAD(P)-dependent dehydrogenase (short-subunit alcohol dehydrogenase family)